MNTHTARSAARGIILHLNPSLLQENGSHIELTRNWASSILNRMNFVKRKASTAKSKEGIDHFMERIKPFLRKKQ